MSARYVVSVALFTLLATQVGCSSGALRLPSHSDAASLAPGADAAPLSRPPVGSVCPDGYSPCGSGEGLRCYDLGRSSAHCGACGKTCAAGIACQAGVCQQYRCNGALSFKTVLFASSESVLALGDFDGDGVLDLVGMLGDDLGGQMSLQYGVGDGTFSAGPIIEDGLSSANTDSGMPLIYYGGQALAADLNGDGRPDLTIIGSGLSGNGSTAVSVLLGTGSRNAPLTAPTSYPTASAAASLLLADFDADGYLDLVVSETQGLEYWRGQAGGQFERQGMLSSAGASGFLVDMSYPGAAVATDWNGDGILDLVYGLAGDSDGIAVGNGGQLLYRLGHGDGSFDAEVVCGLAPGIVGDLDHDGLPDLISSSSSTGATAILLGIKGCSPSRVGSTYWTKGGGIALADLNGDGNLDAIVNDSEAIMIHVGDGQGGFPEALTIPASGITEGIWPVSTFLVGDLNGDGKPDIVFDHIGESGRTWGVLLNTCP